jgi:hypothetical protein
MNTITMLKEIELLSWKLSYMAETHPHAFNLHIDDDELTVAFEKLSAMVDNMNDEIDVNLSA